MVFAEDKVFGKGYTLTDEGVTHHPIYLKPKNLSTEFSVERFFDCNIDLSIVHGIVILLWDEAVIKLTAFAPLEGLQSLRKIHWQQ